MSATTPALSETAPAPEQPRPRHAWTDEERARGDRLRLRTRRAQGLADTIEDVGALREIGALLRRCR